MPAELKELRPGNLASATRVEGAPNKAIVRMLKRALERAKSGELQSLVLVEGLDDGNLLTSFEVHEDQNASMIGALDCCKFDMHLARTNSEG